MQGSALICAFVCIYATSTLGVPQPRIAGGQSAQRRQFPYAVSIQATGNHLEGGSLITPSWVLSAATVLSVLGATTTELSVVAGIIGPSESHADKQVRIIVEVIGHPDFDFQKTHDDICLARVDRPFTLTPAVQPIPLTCGDEGPQIGKAALTAGWGARVHLDPSAVNLQYLELEIITPADCRGTLGNEAELDGNMVCGLPADPHQTSCDLDFGNPLVQDGKLIGIKNGNMYEKCGQEATIRIPDVYTSVSGYLPFIVDAVRVEMCGMTPAPISSTPSVTTPFPSSNTTPSGGSRSNPALGFALLGSLLLLLSCRRCW